MNDFSKTVVQLAGLYVGQAFVDPDSSMPKFQRVNPSAISGLARLPTLPHI
jgi:hypothetical protein